MTPAIKVEHLTKTYSYYHKSPGLRGSISGLLRRQTLERKAVDSISFTVEKGESIGLVGVNGAGKTTTLKLMCGLLYPSSGAISVLNHTPFERQAMFLRRIALVMGQRNALWWDVPAMETLLLHRDIYDLSDADFRHGVNELAELLDVGSLLNVQVRKLSLGERMKMELMAALLHRPEVLFLDEPTIGLDVIAQGRIREFLQKMNAEQGTTIFLTSHYMADIEALCPRVLVIDRGQIGFDGQLTDLMKQTIQEKIVKAVFASIPDLTRLITSFPEVIHHPSSDPRQVRLTVPRQQVADVINELLSLGAIVDLSTEEAPIDDVVRQIFLNVAESDE